MKTKGSKCWVRARSLPCLCPFSPRLPSSCRFTVPCLNLQLPVSPSLPVQLFSGCPIVLQTCLSCLPCDFPALPSAPALPIVAAVSHLCTHTSLCLEVVSSFGARLVFQNVASCSVSLSGKPCLPAKSLVRYPIPLPEHQLVPVVHGDGSDSELVITASRCVG